MNERVGWIFFCKTNVKLLPVVGAAVDGGPENEWKWNTVNKNVLSNTFLFGVCYQYHTTKPFFPLVFHSFSFFHSKYNLQTEEKQQHKTIWQAIYPFSKSRPRKKKTCCCSKRNAYYLLSCRGNLR